MQTTSLSALDARPYLTTISHRLSHPELLKKVVTPFRRTNLFCTWGIRPQTSAAASWKHCVGDALPEGAESFARKLIKLGEQSFVSKSEAFHSCLCFNDPWTKSRNPLPGKAILPEVCPSGEPSKTNWLSTRTTVFSLRKFIAGFQLCEQFSSFFSPCLRHGKICQAVYSVRLRRWRGDLVAS